jgi:two-component system response regulator PhcR
MTFAAPAILYVDDEPQSLKYFTRAFGGEFRVLTAPSAAAAEALLAEAAGGIGVLVTDQRMPVETGAALLGRVKDRYPLVVRLLTTAYADLGEAVSAVNRGEIHRYILKPWDIVALKDELREACALHLRRREERGLLDARREAMVALASQLAHEVATPLATITTAVNGLDRYLGILIAHYRAAGPGPGQPGAIPASVLDALARTPPTLREAAERARILVRLLLVNAGPGQGAGDPLETLSAGAVIEEALSSYPFRPGERERVRVQGQDFALRGAPTLVLHVLYNLLKNALDAVSDAGRGDVVLTMEAGSDWNRLAVTDTGTGIPLAAQPRVFEEFFSLKGSARGAGMGLPFCRRVMTGLGGEIACCSIEGEYTRMELRFPRLEGDDR